MIEKALNQNFMFGAPFQITTSAVRMAAFFRGREKTKNVSKSISSDYLAHKFHFHFRPPKLLNQQFLSNRNLATESLP